jgi:hypothetical protein
LETTNLTKKTSLRAAIKITVRISKEAKTEKGI